MPEFTIKDLPDPANINTDKIYYWKGRTFKALIEIVKQIYRGDNIGRGDATPLQNGDNGYSLQVTRKGGSQDNPGTSNGLHAYSVVNASSGSSPAFLVLPGNHYDATGGEVWIPTLGGVPIFPLPYPTIPCTTMDTSVYFHFTVNPTDGSGASPAGAVTAAEIDVSSSVPPNTLTDIYQLCDGITVTVTGGVALVVPASMGVTGVVAMKNCAGTIVFGPQSS